MPPVQIYVDKAASRLDQFLNEQLPELSRSQIKKLIQQGKVLLSKPQHNIDSSSARPSQAVQPGDKVTVYLPSAPKTETLQPESIPLEIIFEDDDLIVVNKSAGMVVHPAESCPSGTLVNALLAQYPDLISLRESDAPHRPGIVHRLDRDTSGVIVVARTEQTLHHLRNQFQQRKIKKTYLALVWGTPRAPEGIIDVPIGRDPQHRQKMAARVEGRPSQSRYRLLEQWPRHSFLEVKPITGRTHQIRVHLAWLKCPVVADEVYGRAKNPLGLKRQFLHAWRIQIEHPRLSQMIQFEAPLAEDLQQALHLLKNHP